MERSGDFVVYIFLANGGMGGETRSPQQELARELVNVFCGRGSADGWSAILGAVAKALGMYPTPPLPPDFRDPSLFLDLSAKALNFAISPYEPRHALPAASGADIKTSAR